MHTKRKRKRGYNQAQLIAQELAKQLHLPCQQLLEKTAATAAQHTLSAAERRTNLQGVYRVLDEQLVAGKRILLVDDVITTGSPAGTAPMVPGDTIEIEIPGVGSLTNPIERA